MKFKVKSQLDHVEKGGILDDCGPSSTAAAVAWASKYVVDPSAGDGIKAKAKATGFVEKEGVSDNGTSLGDLIKTAKELGRRLATPSRGTTSSSRPIVERALLFGSSKPLIILQ